MVYVIAAPEMMAAAAGAATFHDQFAQNLTTGAFSYTGVENAFSRELQNLENALGRYLLGSIGPGGLP
jgi:hypothetical protein